MSAVGPHDTEENTQPDPSFGEVDGVSETNGHTSASYAVAPHKPPKAHEAGTYPDAVVINATQPLPKAAPIPAPAASSAREVATIITRPRAGDPMNTTTPSLRVVRKRNTVIVVGFAMGILATGIGAIAVVGRKEPGPIVGSESAAATATAAAANATEGAAANATAAAANATANATATAGAAAAAPENTAAPENAAAARVATAMDVATAPSAAAATPKEPASLPAAVSAVGVSAREPRPVRRTAPSATPRASATAPPPKSGNFVEPDRTF